MDTIIRKSDKLEIYGHVTKEPFDYEGLKHWEFKPLYVNENWSCQSDYWDLYRIDTRKLKASFITYDNTELYNKLLKLCRDGELK